MHPVHFNVSVLNYVAFSVISLLFASNHMMSFKVFRLLSHITVRPQNTLHFKDTHKRKDTCYYMKHAQRLLSISEQKGACTAGY